jgi:hypothetical protein
MDCPHERGIRYSLSSFTEKAGKSLKDWWKTEIYGGKIETRSFEKEKLVKRQFSFLKF